MEEVVEEIERQAREEGSPSHCQHEVNCDDRQLQVSTTDTRQYKFVFHIDRGGNCQPVVSRKLMNSQIHYLPQEGDQDEDVVQDLFGECRSV